MLKRTCPVCHSSNVRLASTHRSDYAHGDGKGSKYRCRDCGRSFRTSSPVPIYIFVAAVIGVSAIVAGVFGLHSLSESVAKAEREDASVQFKQILERAKREDPAAEYELYRMYANGTVPAEGAGDASTWLQRSADHGNDNAQYELASAFRDGINVLQDYERAFKWMQRAAETGNPRAQFGLGVMYRDGIGTAQDQVKSYVYLNLAAAQGLPEAVAQRNAIMAKLTPEQLLAAQAEARAIAEARR
jgi:hypothetical protein